ncbi:carboxypeptidase-like regulatory domain-containing protein [Flavobacterium lipolyticum]|uniref:Carboxypeptidase-like regulatory domain-containing protein n=1 Tax=Flavobacterium lipolyticum TaxID=2893754 RepID=A0ABS8M560_9FLAO|nr:carboxypeptidase-like regulatory domain-containing protein [Flavobacterium sp. F-126]MCC9019949.1 carboxypeptidase-like regulatory domain-containing protein [Flavobacterium sp. F-126]
MKNIICISFLIISINTFAQNINGKVFNKNKAPLAGASIYLDGTTIGTVADENGNFTLNYDPKANNILVISFMGYENEYLATFDLKKELNIYLTEAKNKLNEVVVSRKDLFKRVDKLKLFRTLFIGKRHNVVIQNEDDIYFKYDKEKFILRAFSDRPLIIVNPELGYKVDYQLQNFEVKFIKLSVSLKDAIQNYYAGLSHFVEIDSSVETLKRREEAFQGSQIQFFRNLANNTLEEYNFVLSKSNKKVIANNCFKLTKDEFSTKVEVISQPRGLENDKFIASYDLTFNNKEKSNITFETKTFYIYKYGNNSNIENIIFLGKFAEVGVGDMLPLNYGIKDDLQEVLN